MTKTTKTTKTTTPKNTKTADENSRTAKAALAFKNRRTHLGRLSPDREPQVIHCDDGQCVQVELFGRHAAGRFFTIDRDVWERISRACGTQWLASSRTNGTVAIPETFYVSSGRKEAGAYANQPGSRVQNAVLSRLVTGAETGGVVTFKDFDWLNLRAANLEVLSAAEAAKRRGLMLQARRQAAAMERFPELRTIYTPATASAAAS